MATRTPDACPVPRSAQQPSPPHPPRKPTPSNPLAGLDAESCPYSAERQEAELLAQSNNMPPLSQLPAQGQTRDLGVDREQSTIPMGGKFDGKVWVYPSEQMFFNAMRRKNWNPDEKDMGVVVPIHNAVNEQAWHKIQQWESLHASTCSQPKLLKFQGRPKDYTPKARLRQLMGYSLPFDRHDWTVDRCGKKVEYVIDFYSGPKSERENGVSFFLDVRPKMSVEGVVDRFRMWWNTGEGIW
ncbi:hypothetical protein HKX48_003173 [Thoreauomyces humboldtii]|nr:hypothetical protein HKX48_003173 [Thoreauomyces humboldtii]